MTIPTPRTDTTEGSDGTIAACSDLAELARQLEREVSDLTDTLDMMRDEFQRIISCPGCNAEIEGLCERAQLHLIQHVPVIVQRDRAEADLARAKLEIYRLTDDLDRACAAAGMLPMEEGRHQLLADWVAVKRAEVAMLEQSANTPSS